MVSCLFILYKNSQAHQTPEASRAPAAPQKGPASPANRPSLRSQARLPFKYPSAACLAWREHLVGADPLPGQRLLLHDEDRLPQTALGRGFDQDDLAGDALYHVCHVLSRSCGAPLLP